MKKQQKQQPEAREPSQERSRYKVQLILDATVLLLEKGGIDALTTNTVAASAGVSIGTLYQYFPNKGAILDRLADRELAGIADRVMGAMKDPAIRTTEDRIAAVVRAVAQSYGARQTAHRLVMAHSLGRGGKLLGPMLSQLIVQLSSERDSGAVRRAFGRADAFVLTHSFAGVLRAMTYEGADTPPQRELERSLAGLVTRFLRL